MRNNRINLILCIHAFMCIHLCMQTYAYRHVHVYTVKSHLSIAFNNPESQLIENFQKVILSKHIRSLRERFGAKFYKYYWFSFKWNCLSLYCWCPVYKTINKFWSLTTTKKSNIRKHFFLEHSKINYTYYIFSAFKGTWFLYNSFSLHCSLEIKYKKIQNQIFNIFNYTLHIYFGKLEKIYILVFYVGEGLPGDGFFPNIFLEVNYRLFFLSIIYIQYF